MQFGGLEYLWLGLAVLVAAVGVFVRHRRKIHALRLFADGDLLPEIVPGLDHLRGREWRRGMFIVLTVFFLYLALLRPQWGYTWSDVPRRGIDIMVAIDVSASMDAKDVSPSRLERAKREVIDLLDHLSGDRVGLVAFAGVAFLQSPLTYDYAAFRSFLDLVDSELIPIPGTNVEEALNKSLAAFTSGELKSSEGEAVDRDRAIILITDGEEFSGHMEKIRTQALEKGIRIFIFGIGTKEGGAIPVRGGFKRGRSGELILTRLQPEALQKLADATGGHYVESLASEDDTREIYENGIRKMLTEQAEGSNRTKQWNEYFQLPLLLSIACMVFGSRRSFVE